VVLREKVRAVRRVRDIDGMVDEDLRTSSRIADRSVYGIDIE
jgi:hypothetical protein